MRAKHHLSLFNDSKINTNGHKLIFQLQASTSSSGAKSIPKMASIILHPLSPSPPTLRHTFLRSNHHQTTKRSIAFTRQSLTDDADDGYLLDAPVSAGDGFSFSGGKYSDGPNPADDWFKKGRYMKAHPVYGTGEKAKDPIFGLAMGGSSQASTDVFRAYRLKHALCI